METHVRILVHTYWVITDYREHFNTKFSTNMYSYIHVLVHIFGTRTKLQLEIGVQFNWSKKNKNDLFGTQSADLKQSAKIL